jgi:hypothetical protein
MDDTQAESRGYPGVDGVTAPGQNSCSSLGRQAMTGGDGPPGADRLDGRGGPVSGGRGSLLRGRGIEAHPPR